MASASVAELKDGLADYLRKVEEGEEIIITDQGRAMARIVPMPELPAELSEHERRTVAEGRLTRAKKPWDPQAILTMNIPVSDADVVGALLEEREESY